MTNEEGKLKQSSILVLNENVTALKYKTNDGLVRICNTEGEFFQTPLDNWGDRFESQMQSQYNLVNIRKVLISYFPALGFMLLTFQNFRQSFQEE